VEETSFENITFYISFKKLLTSKRNQEKRNLSKLTKEQQKYNKLVHSMKIRIEGIFGEIKSYFQAL
jgi:hypothetical protein